VSMSKCMPDITHVAQNILTGRRQGDRIKMRHITFWQVSEVLAALQKGGNRAPPSGESSSGACMLRDATSHPPKLMHDLLRLLFVYIGVAA
jgi:hypothetical protein